MEELARVLGRERVQLEYLLFKVLVLQHQLRSGEDRFLRWAMEEVNRAGQRLRATECLRREQVSELSRAAGVVAEPDLTLGLLATTAPEPWRTIFAEHNKGFRRLVAELESAIHLTGVLADAIGHAVAEILRHSYRPAALVVALPRDPAERFTELA